MEKSIKELKQSVDIVNIVEEFTNQTLKSRGVEMVGFCPFHKDGKRSLYVHSSKQVFGCFACDDKKGDVVTFLTESYQLEGYDEKAAFKKALEYLKTQSGGIVLERQKVDHKPQKNWVSLPVGPRPSEKILHYRHGSPSQYWEYKTADGKTVGFVCRFNFKDGSKETLPYSYCTNGEIKKWKFKAFLRPRPLYNLDQIVKRKKETILIVEGEKAAAKAESLFPHIVVTCWVGGTNAVGYTDFSPLKNRNVLIWPDNDKNQKFPENHELAGQIKPFFQQPGNAAMMAVYEIIKPFASIVKWVLNGEDLPDKWDVGDVVDWTNEYAREYVSGNLIDVVELKQRIFKKEETERQVLLVSPEMPGASTATVVNEKIPETLPKSKVAEQEQHKNYKSFFQFLGYEKRDDSIVFCFYVKASRTVHKYSGSKLSRLANLINLAPINFWEERFSTDGRNPKIKPELAMNWLVQASYNFGFFSNEKLRGRGAWNDNKRIIYHAGDHLLVDGVKYSLGDIESKYIYEAGPALDYDLSNPLVTFDSNKLLKLLEKMNWSRKIDSYLLAGWCVIAPVCGALKWRPHIWVTGSAGSGKSWTLKDIVRVLLGKTALAVQSQTTEAGLRQTIGADAVPVVFDEAEAEDERQQENLKNIIGYARSASSDDGGSLLKGSTGGEAKKYIARSCFAFGSINVNITQQSDRSRITILSLNTVEPSPQKDKDWEALKKFHAELITEDYGVSLRARTLNVLPTILKNAETFGNAVTTLLGKQRTGDQLGILLAGAYSLCSLKEISYNDACKFIKNKDWNEEKELDNTRDENRLLSHILQRIVRVDRPNAATVERTIGQLVGITDTVIDGDVVDSVALAKLNQLGFKIVPLAQDGAIKPFLAISNTSTHISKMLLGTPWRTNWAKVLSRVDGAVKQEPLNFSYGFRSRAVAIPLSVIH